MKTSTRLTFDTIPYNKDSELHLVVSLTAPKLEVKETRTPILIVPVIDVSGSMEGTKLEFAKQSVTKLIDHLQPGDFIGLVTFETRAELVATVTEINQSKKDELKAKVGKLRSLGSTAFADGMLLALDQVKGAKLPDNTLIRIIMFTDGQANVGPKGQQIIDLLEKNLGKATISAFGYGQDAEQTLLTELSTAANGNYAFIKNPDDAPKAFAKELGGLLSTYAHNIKVDLQLESGHKLEQVVSDVTAVSQDDVHSLRVPEILSEETRSLVVKLKSLQLSQATVLPEPFASQVVKVKISFDTLLPVDGQTSHTVEDVLSVTFVNPGEEQAKPHTDIDAIVAVAQMVRAQMDAEKLAEAGDYNGAHSLMNAVSLNIGGRGHEAIGKTTAKIGARMKTSVAYAASAGYRASTSSGGKRALGVAAADADALEDLNEIGISFTNTTQAAIMESFDANKSPEQK